MNWKTILSGILAITIGGFIIVAVLQDRGTPATVGGPVAESSVVELGDGDTYDLVAKPVEKTLAGKTQRMLAYNGSVPGPLIKVKQGSAVTIRLKNETDWETSLHSHGVRVENAMDGAAPLTQKPVPPGGSFTYKLRFPDAGAYWYHPHVREDATQELGLYGMFLVEPKEAAYWNPVNREVPLVLDDVLLKNGFIVPFDKRVVTHALMGRFGDTMIVNGTTDYRLTTKKGEVIRFYALNVANTRPFRLKFGNAKMKYVGSDGGRAAHDEWADDGVLIGPSERAVVEVKFDKPGQVQIEHWTPERSYMLGRVTVSDEPAPTLVGDFDALQEASAKGFPDLAAWYDREPDKRVRLDIDLGMMGGSTGMAGHGGMMGGSMGSGMMVGEAPEDGIEWEQPADPMNAMSTSQSVKWKLVEDATGRENMDIDWKFQKDGYAKIRLVNDPDSAHPMQHPIHFHGQQFIVLARDGKRDDNPVWKDTVFVKAGETVDILLSASNPGEWMMHCHIPEHMESGMMGTFKVE
jgi:FtsP/CotA-like multicopper oxidase with cupredoxin domain